MVAVVLLLMASDGQTQTVQETGGPRRRIALVVGNQKYSKLPPLPAVPQETELIRAALERANFSVVEAKDATQDDLDKVLNSFTAQVQPGDVCFFYYSGYAVQDATDDRLVPIDFDPSVAGNLRNLTYPLTFLAENLEPRKAFLKMFFLEGRRVDASIPDMRPGLRLPDTGFLTEVLFGIPAATDQPTSAPPDKIGLFTAALAQVIDREGVAITQVMPEVLKEVMEKSNGQQQPDNRAKLTHAFDFHPKVAPPPPPPPLPPVSQNSNDHEDYKLIPAGTFLMGCVPSDRKCDKNEKPQHQVTLSKPFWMGVNEVRVTSYERYVRADPKHRKMPPSVDWNKKWKQFDSHPISNMTWDEAKAYCEWAGGRLPTEAEWEYADRGGKENQIYPFDLADARNKANFSGKQGGIDIWDISTAPARSFAPNEYRLFDLAGNVWEFVNDWYAADYYASSPKTDPQGPPSGKQHVRRGGSFYSDAAKHLRISYREPSDREVNVGFRCVMDDNANSRRVLQIQ